MFDRVSGTVNFHPFNPATAPKVCCHYTTSGLVINRRHFGPGDKVPLVRIAGVVVVVVVVDVFPLRVFSPRGLANTRPEFDSRNLNACACVVVGPGTTPPPPAMILSYAENVLGKYAGLKCSSAAVFNVYHFSKPSLCVLIKNLVSLGGKEKIKRSPNY